MHSSIRSVFACLVFSIWLILAGCMPRSTKPDVVMVPETGDGQIVRLMDYVSNVLSLPQTAQASAQENLKQQYKLTQFPEDRMRLALLDILLPDPSRNLNDAVTLLSGYNWEAVGPGFKGLANLLLNIANSQQANATVAHSLSQQLTVERSQKDHLQQQLDELKSIEKTMDKRDKTMVAPPIQKLPPAASSHSPAPATPPWENF